MCLPTSSYALTRPTAACDRSRAKSSSSIVDYAAVIKRRLGDVSLSFGYLIDRLTLRRLTFNSLGRSMHIYGASRGGGRWSYDFAGRDCAGDRGSRRAGALTSSKRAL